ncbi:IS110 family transposase, partial [Siminovitchia terrae]
TTTKGLLSLSDWLATFKVTDVVMESTGVYWKPVWNILEGTFHLILANAKHVKNVPGRKTDVKDAEWLAQLLRCGLIEGNFVPPED